MRKKTIVNVFHYAVKYLLIALPVILLLISLIFNDTAQRGNATIQNVYKYQTNVVNSVNDLVVDNAYHINTADLKFAYNYNSLFTSSLTSTSKISLASSFSNVSFTADRSVTNSLGSSLSRRNFFTYNNIDYYIYNGNVYLFDFDNRTYSQVASGLSSINGTDLFYLYDKVYFCDGSVAYLVDLDNFSVSSVSFIMDYDGDIYTNIFHGSLVFEYNGSYYCSYYNSTGSAFLFRLNSDLSVTVVQYFSFNTFNQTYYSADGFWFSYNNSLYFCFANVPGVSDTLFYSYDLNSLSFTLLDDSFFTSIGFGGYYVPDDYANIVDYFVDYGNFIIFNNGARTYIYDKTTSTWFNPSVVGLGSNRSYNYFVYNGYIYNFSFSSQLLTFTSRNQDTIYKGSSGFVYFGDFVTPLPLSSNTLVAVDLIDGPLYSEGLYADLCNFFNDFANLSINQWYISFLQLFGLSTALLNSSLGLMFYMPLWITYIFIFDLFLDALLMLPKTAHHWMEKIGGDYD